MVAYESDTIEKNPKVNPLNDGKMPQPTLLSDKDASLLQWYGWLLRSLFCAPKGILLDFDNATARRRIFWNGYFFLLIFSFFSKVPLKVTTIACGAQRVEYLYSDSATWWWFSLLFSPVFIGLLYLLNLIPLTIVLRFFGISFYKGWYISCLLVWLMTLVGMVQLLMSPS